MQKFYLAANHNVIRLFQKNRICFPITKKELLDKAGNENIQIDFDKTVTLAEYCENIKIDSFANKSQFFCALIGSTFTL